MALRQDLGMDRPAVIKGDQRRMDWSGSPAFRYGSGDRPVGSGYGSGSTF